jgi:hypothetical protein
VKEAESIRHVQDTDLRRFAQQDPRELHVGKMTEPDSAPAKKQESKNRKKQGWLNLTPFTCSYLIGVPASRSAGKRGPAPTLQRQLERVQALPKAEQRVVSEVLDSLLAQAGR